MNTKNDVLILINTGPEEMTVMQLAAAFVLSFGREIVASNLAANTMDQDEATASVRGLNTLRDGLSVPEAGIESVAAAWCAELHTLFPYGIPAKCEYFRDSSVGGKLKREPTIVIVNADSDGCVHITGDEEGVPASEFMTSEKFAKYRQAMADHHEMARSGSEGEE